MSKTKSTSKASKRAEPDLLTKVKDAAITKPAQVVKAKSKELAKQVIGKEEKSKSKKDKKRAKEPTPEPSESEDSDVSAASSESEGEEETTKPVVKGKANGVKKSAPKEESSDESDSESSASSESEAEAKAPKVNGSAKKTKVTEAKAEVPTDESEESDSDESMVEAKADSSDAESEDDESSEDEKPVKKAAPKAVEAKKPTKAAKADSESESENNGDSDEASDSSDESEDEEKETAAKSSKRKADDEAEPTAKKTKTAAVETSKGSNLFVGNLSWNVDEAWLREIFEEFGELAGVRLMTDRDSGRSKGFGYIEFVNAEDAAKAHAEKAGTEVDGRAMNVDYANARPDNSQKQENRRKSYGDQTSEASDTLFLGNLSFEVGQETVTEAFAPHGTVLGIRLPTDRETGQPKGFGYVTFSSVEEAKAALEAMQGAYIEGRPVRLDYSSPRPQNSDSPARGRGGFGGRGGAGGRGGRGGRGGNFSGRGGRGGRGGGRGGSTNRGGFGDYSGRKVSFD